MKKILATPILMVILLPLSVSAKTEKAFDSRSTGVTYSLSQKKSRFDFAVDMKSTQVIKYWEARFYCEERMKISFRNASENVCGKEVIFENLTDGVYFIYDNQNQAKKKFAIKLKAYDQNIKWISSDKESFYWR